MLGVSEKFSMLPTIAPCRITVVWTRRPSSEARVSTVTGPAVAAA